MLEILSFKLRFADEHARVMPKTDARGCPFAGPGVDLRGEDAQRAFAAAKPLIALLAEAEPGVVVRSLSVDLAKPRLLCTLEPSTPEKDPRPRVVRIEEGPLLRRMLGQCQAVISVLADASERALRRREKKEG